MSEDAKRDEQSHATTPKIISMAIGLDMETWQFTITGDVPRLEIGLLLARHLVYELEGQVAKQKQSTILPGTALPFMSRGRH